MRETEKIFINNKFCGYGFKRNHQERVVNRTSTNDTTNTTEIIQKLGQLEDIEEELGIDLIILFKAFKNGIWVKFNENGDQIVFYKAPYKTLAENIGYFRRLFEKEYAENYGKTWALTKEELK